MNVCKVNGHFILNVTPVISISSPESSSLFVLSVVLFRRLRDPADELDPSSGNHVLA